MIRNTEGAPAAPLLAVVERVKPGRWLAIASSGIAEEMAHVPAGVGIERLSSSLFAVMSVSKTAGSPLIGWLADASDDESLDAFFTVQGTARDSERRELEMGRLPEVPDHAWHNVDTVVAVESTAEFVFFVCVGGETDTVTELLAQPEARAA